MTPTPNWPGPPAASAITVGASPFSFMNPNPGNVNVSGGTVSLIEISRDGLAFFTTGLLGGLFFLCPSDWIRVTYTLTPTMTWFPVL